MRKTFAEKILGQKAGKSVIPGEIVEVKPDIAMSHDNTAAISKTFREIGVAKIDDPNRHVIVLDHCVPAANEKFAQNHKDIRAFVAEQGIPNFFDIDRGICHQVLPEEGFALPGYLMVGSDSHSTTYGAFGALATGIGRSEMAVIFATGKIWLRVPETMKIVIKGSLPKGISSKDVMLKIIGDLSADGGLYKSVWFTGPVITEMSVSDRMVLTNMAVEFGAKNGYMEPDDKTLAFLKGRARAPFTVVTSDPDAEMESVHEFDISDLEPLVACPHSVDNVKPVSAVKGTRIDQVFFGSCTNARIKDFEIVAGVMKGRKVHPSCRMVVIPASRQVFLEALAKGYIQILAEAGATIVNSGCAPAWAIIKGFSPPASGS